MLYPAKFTFWGAIIKWSKSGNPPWIDIATGNEVIFFDDLEEDTFKNGGTFIVALKKEKN